MATARPKRDVAPGTPFHQLPGDVLQTTARRLGELGLDGALAAAIRRPGSEKAVQEALRELRVRIGVDQAETVAVPKRSQRPRLIHGMFTTSDRQLANVRLWAAQRLEAWKDVPIEQWLAQLGPIPDWPSGRLQCVTLEVALPDRPEVKDKDGNVVEPAAPGYIRTVRDFWGIISGQHPNHRKWDEFQLDAEHLFLLEGATYEPGLRWRILDLGANWDKTNGIRPIDVRNAITSPNVDGFAALAHHPEFVRRMDGVKVPYLWIAGCQVTVPGRGPRRYVPVAGFGRGGRRVGLGAGWGGYPGSDCAVPSRLGV